MIDDGIIGRAAKSSDRTSRSAGVERLTRGEWSSMVT
jgi:hypothetical protein